MPESDVLLTIAEVAVAFAGFASLVGVLGQRSSADDPRVIGVRMRGMLLSSLMVVGFSIFPILLAAYGASPDRIWLASSLVLLGVTAGYYWWFVKALQSLSGLPTTRFQSVVVMPTLVTVMFSLCGALFANVFFASPALYLTALALLLFQSGFAFSLIVFSFIRRVDTIEDRPEQGGGED